MGWGRVDGGEHGELSPGQINNGKEDVCGVNEGGAVFNSRVKGVMSTAVEEVVAVADAASEVEVAEKRQLR